MISKTIGLGVHYFQTHPSQGAVKQREVWVADLTLRCGAVGAKYLCRMLRLGGHGAICRWKTHGKPMENPDNGLLMVDPSTYMLVYRAP